MDNYLQDLDRNIQGATKDNTHCDEYNSMKVCDLFYFVLHGIIGTLIWTIGITGNILSLIIIHKMNKNKKSATIVESKEGLWAFIHGKSRFSGLQSPLGITNGNRSHNKPLELI